MSKNEAQTALVPRLRFPEFRAALEWPSVPLSRLAERVTIRNTSESTTRVLTNSAEHGVMDQRDYFNKDIATKGSLSHYSVVEHGDYVYNPRVSSTAPAGPISRNNVGQGVMSPLYTVFRFKHGDTDFYYHYFKSASWHDYLRTVSSTGARHDRMSLTNADFMRMPLPTPDPEEQQKIADCLGSLDNLIKAEGRKLALLRSHKQGLMQQLFPREGESQPQLRFPEFRDAGVWQIQELGNMTSKVGSGITPKGGSKNYTESGRPFVRSQNVGWGYLLLDDMVHIDEDTHASFDGTEIEEGDVLLNISGASIGRSAVADRRIASGNVNQHVCIIRTDQTSIHPIMLSQYLGSDLGQEQVDRCQAGGNRQGLNFSQIRSFMIPVPYSYSEQQRIADCLSALDDRIAAQTEKLDALRSHKHGLLQQLFPAPPLEGVAT